MPMENRPARPFPYTSKNHFYNDSCYKPESFWFGTVPSLIKSMAYQWYRKPITSNICMPASPVVPASDKLLITWIGHSSFLIQVGKINILVDPVFSSPSWFFPRLTPPGIAHDYLPHIDYILLSHNHPDHMEKMSLQRLKKRFSNVRILVAHGDKAWFDRQGFDLVSEHMWWDQIIYESSDHQSQIIYTFLPAWHWSQQGIFDKNKSLWGSWMIECNGYRIYVAGDTAYATHFKSIAREFDPIDLALLPIGPCEPRSWMRHTHMDVVDSYKAFQDLQARYFIPMHWGTFAFGTDEIFTPITRLKNAWPVDNYDQLRIMKIGERQTFEPWQQQAIMHEEQLI
jgi:L-ascorbate metabolism protein UlaG (beta-lactamase superfamily)